MSSMNGANTHDHACNSNHVNMARPEIAFDLLPLLPGRHLDLGVDMGMVFLILKERTHDGQQLSRCVKSPCRWTVVRGAKATSAIGMPVLSISARTGNAGAKGILQDVRTKRRRPVEIPRSIRWCIYFAYGI